MESRNPPRNELAATANAPAGASAGITRRSFVGQSAGAVAATLGVGALAGCAPGGAARPGVEPFAGLHVAGTDVLRVGLVGCGGRGTGAAMDCANAAPGVIVTALGDVFRERVDECRKNLAPLGDKLQVSDERCFAGFDAYRGVVASGVDVVLLCTPPGFRPMQLRAAVDAGKHVFMEKPVAVDPAGVRSVIESSATARQKGLGIVAGTQRRHQANYLAAMKRIHDGAIGEIVSANCYWIGGELWMHPRQPEWTDMEWQLRNWLYFTWLSGDHIVEQHVHNLDVINWALRAVPVKCLGMGGRQKRVDPQYGHGWDHFAVEYEYPSGVVVTSMCRQSDNCTFNVSELLVGTKGRSDACNWIRGRNAWQFSGNKPNPYQQEHTDLIASIRAGRPLNEGRRIAESTLTAIMGRMSAYTGREVTWEEALASEMKLMPERLEFGPLPTPAVAVPGMSAPPA